MRTESCERPESDRRQEEKCVVELGLAANTGSKEPPDWRDRAERGEINQILGTEEYWLASQCSDLVSGNDVIIRAVLQSVPLFMWSDHYLGRGWCLDCRHCHPVTRHQPQIQSTPVHSQNEGQTPLETQSHGGRSVSIKFDYITDVCKLNWQMLWF